MPLAPHWLSEMYPVQVPSAANASATAQRVSAKPAANFAFMCFPLLISSFLTVHVRRTLDWHRAGELSIAYLGCKTKEKGGLWILPFRDALKEPILPLAEQE